MRYAALLFLIALIASPAWAQDDASSDTGTSSTGVGHSFANTTCSQHVPCPDSETPYTSSQLIANANSCITQFFALHSQSGFFDETQGLGADNCLTALPNVIPKGMGSQMAPYCCLVKLPDNSCTFRCDMVTTK